MSTRRRRAPAARRPWRPVSLLSVVVVVLTVVVGSVGPAAADSVDPSAPSDLVPDVALLVDAGPEGLEAVTLSALADRLGRIDGVTRITVDGGVEGSTVFYLALVESGPERRPTEAVVGDARQVAITLTSDDAVTVGGSAVVDDAIEQRFEAGSIALVALAALVGLAAGVAFGWRRGALAAVTLAAAVLAAGALAGRLLEPFDGTIAATAVPGALAGLVVGGAATIRLLLWFRSPIGDDGADVVRRAIADLVPELTLVVVGTLLASLVIDLLGPGRSAMLVPVAGASVAALVVLAVLPAGLTVLEARWPEPRAPRRGWFPVSIPDGAGLPLAVLAAFALALVGLSLFALRAPNRQLADHRYLPADDEAAQVGERLSGSDATAALVAEASDDTLSLDFDGWAALVAERPDVAWVDTGSSRYFASGPAAVEPAARLVPAGTEGVAVIVPAVDARSAEGQDLVGRIAAVPLAGGPPILTGDAVGARHHTDLGAAGLVAVLALAAAGAAAAAALTQSTTYAATVLVLRLLGGGATVGVFRLMVPEATAADSLVVLTLLALAAGLFELEYARSLIHHAAAPADLGPPPAETIRLGLVAVSAETGSATPLAPANPGQGAAVGAVVLGLGGAVLLAMAPFGGGPGAGLFGLGLAVVVAVDGLVGSLVLRPALLGQRAAFHTAIRPLRLAVHSDHERRTARAQPTEDPSWRRIVDDLLQTEFRLQADPDRADLGAIFLEGTPLHRQAVSHHGSMVAAALRVAGRSPQLQRVRAVGGRTEITLAVTVDHPERTLIDRTGTVVGIRRAERRSGVLWLSRVDGSYRIAESIELGAVPLGTEAPEAPGPAAAATIDLDRPQPTTDAAPSDAAPAPGPAGDPTPAPAGSATPADGAAPAGNGHPRSSASIPLGATTGANETVDEPSH